MHFFHFSIVFCCFVFMNTGFLSSCTAGEKTANSLGYYFGWNERSSDLKELAIQSNLYSETFGLSLSSWPQQYDIRTYLNNNPDKWPGLWPVRSQGSLNSCVSHALEGALTFNWLIQTWEERRVLDIRSFSRLFIYYNGRVKNNTIDEDSGITVTEAVQGLQEMGFCIEEDWPYTKPFQVKPSPEVYKDARETADINNDGQIDISVAHIVSIDERIDYIKHALYTGKTPVAFGLFVMKMQNGGIPFTEVGSDGVLPTEAIPLLTREIYKQRGGSTAGHSMLIVGYDDAKECFTVRNSFGETWGNGGYCYIPYRYLLSDWADDFWVIKKLSPTGSQISSTNGVYGLSNTSEGTVDGGVDSTASSQQKIKDEVFFKAVRAQALLRVEQAFLEEELRRLRHRLYCYRRCV